MRNKIIKIEMGKYYRFTVSYKYKDREEVIKHYYTKFDDINNMFSVINQDSGIIEFQTYKVRRGVFYYLFANVNRFNDTITFKLKKATLPKGGIKKLLWLYGYTKSNMVSEKVFKKMLANDYYTMTLGYLCNGVIGLGNIVYNNTHGRRVYKRVWFYNKDKEIDPGMRKDIENTLKNNGKTEIIVKNE